MTKRATTTATTAYHAVAVARSTEILAWPESIEKDVNCLASNFGTIPMVVSLFRQYLHVFASVPLVTCESCMPVRNDLIVVSGAVNCVAG